MPPSRLAVVVVTYNSAAVLPECLAGIAGAAEGVQIAAVVVADNASRDACVEIADATPGVQVVKVGRNAGYAAGVNAAVASLPLAELDAILVLNPDIRLRPGTIAALAETLRRPWVGIAVPRLENPDGSLQVSLRRRPTIRRALGEAVIGGDRAGRIDALGELITDPARYEVEQSVAWATGAAMLISRETVERVGEWDESLLLYGEETDYALRAGDLGLQVRYRPDVVLEHIGGQMAVDPFLWALMTLNRTRVYARRHGRVRSAIYFTAVLLGEAVRAAAGRPTARAAVRLLLVPSARPTQLPP